MNTNITKTWTVEINENDVFARCINESLYHSKGGLTAIQDDDKAQFHMYFTSAIAGLNTILARRMETPVCYGDDNVSVVFILHMHDNHDDNILPTLIIHCYDYVVKKILESWYHNNFGSELEKLEINHCIHYRTNPVHRRIRPLF